jgi:sugar/nucleoside kinase (ribokinase family)
VRPLAVIGNIARDVVDGGPPRIGGGAYYAAQALRLTASPARIATKSAPADRELVQRLVRLGVPVSWRPAASTAAFSFTYDGDERRMTVDELGEPWTPREAVEAAGDAVWVHLAALARSDFPPATLAALARGGRRISFDGQGLTRVPHVGPLEVDDDFDREVLRHVRILKLAEDEAAVVGARDEDGLRALGVPEILLTRGSRGSLIWWRGRLEPVVAQRLARATDPTGAGDAFAASYLAARALGYEPRGAARRASSIVSTLLSRRR